MAASTSDLKPNQGLANSLSNVFKLADVNGLKWVRYVGPNSSTLEAPKDDPVLISYARLLNQGYACSWRRLNPCTDGFSGEAKDLWVFYFTDLPNITDKLSEELKEDRMGSWEEGMTSESSTMLYRALHNIIERSLLSENFLPLGKWFVQPDASVTTDGSSRGCFLCSFSFFVHAHLYICASVDMRVGPSLQTLLNSHINQALASSTGLQVILSPSGLNAVMTGHSYKTSDAGISDILEEWKLFYPRRFDLDLSPSLPAAIEVVTGGVRMRYPSQFVFVYHGDETVGSQPCTLENSHMQEFMQETWTTANCVDTLQQQKDSTNCRCNEARNSSLRRSSGQLDLPLRMSVPRQSSTGRYEPYSTRNSRAKELATPGSINLMNQPALNTSKLGRQKALPKYAAPLSSPSLMPSLSPTIHGKMATPSISSSLPLPTINPISAPTTTSSGVPASISICPKAYDQSKVPPSYLKGGSAFTYTQCSSSFVNVTPSSCSMVQTSMSLGYPFLHTSLHTTDRWWQCLDLPESMESLTALLLPRMEFGGRGIRNSISQMSPSLTPTALTPSKKISSPKGSRSSRSSFDIGTPGLKSTLSPMGFNSSPLPNSTSTKRPSVSKANGGPRGKSRGGGKKGSVGEMGYLGGYMGTDDGFEGLGSPLSDVGGDHTQHINGINGEGDELFPPKSHGIDVFMSDKAVKIEATSLDQIFASDEEDEGQEAMEVSCSPFLDPSNVRPGSEDKMDTTSIKPTKLSASEPIELSLIYPTPPSVENNEGDKFDEIKMSGVEGNEHFIPNLMWDTGMDEDLGPVPTDFRPLAEVHCFSSQFQSPQKLQYHKSSSKSVPTTSSASATYKKNLLTAHSFNSEPEQFIFPPPVSLSASRALAPPTREGLTLPLSRHAHFSPHLTSSRSIASSLSSSPAYPYPRAPGRHPPPGIPRHLPSSSVSALTPLESPTVTPTPLSATTNRLMPVLPEANGLYVNYSLLDSALGSNLSETSQVSNGPLLTTIQNFMKFSSRRMKLDSVADPMEGGAIGRVNSTTNLLSYQDEKPMMTFGIADYPSLGFKEELAGMGGFAQTAGSCNTLYGCLSKLASLLSVEVKVESQTDPEAAVREFPMEKFLEVLQDYCVHLSLTGSHEDTVGLDGGSASLQERHHLLGRPQDRCDMVSLERGDVGCLYYSHSVVSAILSAKQLVAGTGGGKGGGGGTPRNMTKPPALVTLSKEDNSGAWIKDLLTLPTKLMTKRLKVLKSVLQNSFHQAPCLKFTTKGPLTLKDLQQLTPSMTALGDECQALPVRPVIVGYDHEWLSVSPLAISSWDKLLFEPFSMRKNVAYLVVVPPDVSSGASLTMPLRKYFRELSITFKNCQLGQHVPLEKGIGEDGILFVSDLPASVASPPQPSPAAAESSSGDQQQQQQQGTSTDDPNTNKRHGEPAGIEDFREFCKKVLTTYLANLPKDGEEILSTYAAPNCVDRTVPSSLQPSPSTPPFSIVLYVLCNNLLHTTDSSPNGSNLAGMPSPSLGKMEGDNSGSSGNKLDCFKVMRAISDLLGEEDLPLFIKERIVFQFVDPKELLGPSSGNGGQLRSLAFSIFSRCHPNAEITIEGARSLTTFGPIADRRQHDQIYPYSQINAPPFVLSSEPPLSSIGPVIGTQTHHILLDPDQPVLFCGYCVSPDRRWMLVVCCDRQGEMLDTSVIGIPYTGGYDIDNSRFLALQKLWAYLISIVSSSLHCWSIVITRFGKPSTSEISNWPCLFPDDGLLTANQVLRGDCSACTHTSSRPHISNVIILSIQPERNIQLFPSNDSSPPVSHAIVLPQDPNSGPPPGATPSVLPDTSQDDALDIFGMSAGAAGVGMDSAMDGTGLEFDLTGINIHEELSKSQVDYTPTQEDTSPKATGYLISTAPPGDLPAEFWGHDRPQSTCSMFKVLLHCHRSEKAIPDSPQETLGSTLLCFDALSWLTMDHSSRQRRTCLPLHLHVLAKLYHLFTVLDRVH